MRSELVGSWKLTAAEYVNADGTVRPLHGSAVGRICYDPDGYVTAQTMPAKRPAYASGNPMESTPEELGIGAAKVVSYYGTYEVDEVNGVIRHYVEMAALPNWIGGIQERNYELNGDALVLTAPLPTDGEPGQVRLCWERLGAG